MGQQFGAAGGATDLKVGVSVAPQAWLCALRTMARCLATRTAQRRFSMEKAVKYAEDHLMCIYLLYSVDFLAFVNQFIRSGNSYA
ncbi:hypothetical protein ACHEXK_07635 [Limnohabitans sp. DCL3]|uniref:hypothetical protein n=1 Tax=Limnohabitans sp. DCL3 TaxID=3374103 RepID=UPI003A849D5F